MLTLEALEIEQGGFHLAADLVVETAQITAVIGPSGGGKSTLLNAIAGFIPPVTGAVCWQGQSLNETTPGNRPISMIFQDNNLFPHLTAFQNVALGLDPSLKLKEAEKTRVEKALSRVGLAGLEARKPAALSGGQASRVALARVLVRDRAVLLLDEPFAALGPALRAEMLDLVAELVTESGATTLMVTHEPADAMRVAGQMIFVDGGRVYEPTDTKTLMAEPFKELRDYLGR